MLEGVDESWGPVTVLVNNAGIASPGSVEDVSLEEWERVVAINQTSADTKSHPS